MAGRLEAEKANAVSLGEALEVCELAKSAQIGEESAAERGGSIEDATEQFGLALLRGTAVTVGRYSDQLQLFSSNYGARVVALVPVWSRFPGPAGLMEQVQFALLPSRCAAGTGTTCPLSHRPGSSWPVG
jgi:hypothetical protein